MSAWELEVIDPQVDGLDESLRRYVLSSWLRSARAGRLEHDAVAAHKLLCRSVCRLVVATPPEIGPPYVAGWCLFTPTSSPVIHYAYVRAHHRRSGAARAMLAAAGLDPTQRRLTTTQAGRLPRAVREAFESVAVVGAADSLL